MTDKNIQTNDRQSSNSIKTANADEADNILNIRNLTKSFRVKSGIISKNEWVYALDNISLSIGRGDTLGLVGESGCGKSTLGRCIVRLYKPQTGELEYNYIDDDGQPQTADLAQLSNKQLKAFRADIQMIFQDPFSSLNPRMTVFNLISEPLIANKITSKAGIAKRVIELAEMVGLNAQHLRRYPHAFSGGQRQRIGIARALATNPKLLVADEAVSALDVSIQAQILNLLDDLKINLNLSYLFIAHDLSVVRYISDRVAVMYLGRIVELADTDELYTNPQHPYTEALISAVPKSEPDDVVTRISLNHEIPNPSAPPKGCHLHPRCQYAKDKCKTDIPALRETKPGHFAACHFAEELSLIGVKDEE